MSQTITIKVKGMSCDHCVHAVREALEGLAGVSSVTVDLDSGQAVLVAAEAIDQAAISQVIDEAGYDFVGLL
jgi:copper ion binding protein